MIKKLLRKSSKNEMLLSHDIEYLYILFLESTGKIKKTYFEQIILKLKDEPDFFSTIINTKELDNIISAQNWEELDGLVESLYYYDKEFMCEYLLHKERIDKSILESYRSFILYKNLKDSGINFDIKD
jgi:hypothetical protein